MVKVQDFQFSGTVFKTTGWTKVGSIFHPSKVDKVSTRNFRT